MGRYTQHVKMGIFCLFVRGGTLITSASSCSVCSYRASILFRFSGLTICFWMPGLPAVLTIWRKFFSCGNKQKTIVLYYLCRLFTLFIYTWTCFTCTPRRKVKARPAFPALAVLPILNTDTESRRRLQSKLQIIRQQSVTYRFDAQLTCEYTSWCTAVRRNSQHIWPRWCRCLWLLRLCWSFFRRTIHWEMKANKMYLTAVLQREDLNSLVREILLIYYWWLDIF